MQGLWKYDLMILVAVGGAIAFADDHYGAQVTAEHVKAADERKADVKPADRLALTHPLPCDFTATHSGPQGIDRTRCYVRPEAK